MPPYEKCFRVDWQGNIFPTERPASCNSLIKVAPFYGTPPTEQLWVKIQELDRYVCISSRTIEQLARLLPRMKKMRWPTEGTEI